MSVGVGGHSKRAARATRWWLLVASALSAGLLAAGCHFGSSFRYVSHRAPDGVDLYFKVPSNWTVFNTDQVLEAQNGKLGPTQLKQLSTGEWIETMSNRPGITAKASIGIGKRYPTALVLERQLSASERDSLNFAAMRSELLGTDPLTAASGFQILDYSDFTASGGIRGIKMVVNITSTTPVLTFGQITAVDAGTNYIFTIGVGCEASCWSLNASAINTLLKSWTLKEQAP
jgi:hypothetical protein